MKKTITLILMAFSLSAFSQTLIHTDTLTDNGNTLYLKWYHESFFDKDGKDINHFRLENTIGLVREWETPDTTYTSVMIHWVKPITESDTVYHSVSGNPFTATFIRTYIYSTDEGFKRDLSWHYVMNTDDRFVNGLGGDGYKGEE